MSYQVFCLGFFSPIFGSFDEAETWMAELGENLITLATIVKVDAL